MALALSIDVRSTAYVGSVTQEHGRKKPYGMKMDTRLTTDAMMAKESKSETGF